MSQKELFSHAAPILAVTNVLEAAEYYRDKLGFTIEFLWQDPPTYAVIRRGEGVSIHFTYHEVSKRPTVIYIFVYDVDKVYEEYQSKGVNITVPIADRDYQMRDFELTDPWGNILAIGKGIAPGND